MQAVAAVALGADSRATASELETKFKGALPRSADLLFLFATPHHIESLVSLRDRVRDAVGARHVLGCIAAQLIGGDREVEDEPAVSALALCCDGAQIETFHATLEPKEDDEAELKGFPFDRMSNVRGAGVIVLADPYTFPADWLMRASNERAPGVPLCGGLGSGAPMPGWNRLLVDDQIASDGAIGAVIGGRLGVKSFVSQGCRPVGRHFVITKGKENIIDELSGQSALACLTQVLEGLTAADRELFSRAIHVGRVIDEYKSEFGRGDFLVRSVIGIDRSKGAVAINDFVRRGQTVQFLVRDPSAATGDLEGLVADHAPFFRDHRPGAALLFSCNGRGSRMFGAKDHDVKRVRAIADELPVAGFFAAGEIGPVGGQNFLHGFSASVAVLYER